MKGLELRNKNCSIAIYPENGMVCIQVTKKKTKDKFYLEKKEWLALSGKALEICFPESYKEVNDAIEKSFEQRIIMEEKPSEVKIITLD